jgi:hypothetical protein
VTHTKTYVTTIQKSEYKTEFEGDTRDYINVPSMFEANQRVIVSITPFERFSDY